MARTSTLNETLLLPLWSECRCAGVVWKGHYLTRPHLTPEKMFRFTYCFVSLIASGGGLLTTAIKIALLLNTCYLLICRKRGLSDEVRSHLHLPPSHSHLKTLEITNNYFFVSIPGLSSGSWKKAIIGAGYNC